MLRWLIVFGAVLVVGSLTFPLLRGLGMAWMPGDVTLELQGYRLFLPFTTSLLISSAVAGAWRLLEPP